MILQLKKAASQLLQSRKPPIPENILAFRTITTLLSAIQQHKPFKLMQDVNLQPELRLCTAFSTVAVINHEVVAVVAKRIPEILEVIVCTAISPDQNQQVATQSLASNSIFSDFSNFLFVKNPRRNDLPQSRSESSDPVINATEPSPDLKPKPGYEELKQYIEKPRSIPTLTTHLHTLSQLLALQDLGNEHTTHASALSKLLLRYVIATSHRKMQRRLAHPTLSRPYFISLAKVTSVSFHEPSQKASDTNKEISNDQQFLEIMHKYTLKNVQFSKLFPHVAYQAKLAHEGQPFQLYNRDTHLEFHRLLLHFLQRFLDSLSKLKSFKPVTSDVPTAFNDSLEAVVSYGLALQKLSKSAALRTHLQVIEPILRAHHFGNTTTSIPVPKSEDEEKQDESECDENDEELEAVQPFITSVEDAKRGTIVPLWKSYGNWLKLLVVHFDAVDVLVRHFTQSRATPITVSLQILVSPPMDQSLLPIPELIESRHFPTKSDESRFTNKEIGTFLRNTINTQLRTQEVDKSWNKVIKQPSSRQLLSSMDAALSQLSKFETPFYSKDCRDTLSTKFETWKEADSQPSRDHLQNEITVIVNKLVLTTDFLTPGDMKTFSGSLHCEACLASLLSHQTTNVDTDSLTCTLAQMKGYSRVIGVSKRCCPVCQYLIEILGKGNPFVVRGSHGTVTACTLPTWLPASIVDSMNKHFGGLLRREIVDLMGNHNILRERAPSTGSERISSDSVERPGYSAEFPDEVIEQDKFNLVFNRFGLTDG